VVMLFCVLIGCVAAGAFEGVDQIRWAVSPYEFLIRAIGTWGIGIRLPYLFVGSFLKSEGVLLIPGVLVVAGLIWRGRTDPLAPYQTPKRKIQTQ